MRAQFPTKPGAPSAGSSPVTPENVAGVTRRTRLPLCARDAGVRGVWRRSNVVANGLINLFLLFGTACGGGSPTDAATVTSIVVSPGAVSLGVFGTSQLTATPTDVDGNALTGRQVSWTSSNVAAANVSSDGLVTALAPGTTVVTATSEGVQATAIVTVLPMLGVSALSAGGYHTCGLTAGGAAFCWGDNSAGWLGDGTLIDRSTPARVSGGPLFTRLSTGTFHTCGLTSTGEAYCWGDNLDGQLGVGTNNPRSLAVPMPVAGSVRFMDIAVSQAHHTCALTASGAAFCWGPNYAGQLGDSTISHRSSPVAVKGSLAFTNLTAGWEHTCGLTRSGEAYCWGDGFAGALGVGVASRSTSPTAVGGSLTFASITAGRGFTCGLTRDGTAYCWGVNNFGQIGTGRATFAEYAPVAVAGGLKFSQLTAGESHACGVTIGGAAYCWGRDQGYLGLGSVTSQQEAPAAVSGGHAYRTLSAGTIHTCGVTLIGIAYCWGSNHVGQLGDGTGSNGPVPRAVRNP